MKINHSLDHAFLILIGALFLWFFASSFSIAYHRAPQQDDAMFATIPKNFLNGHGWTSNYGERIPFNPDLTAGPALLIPAIPLIVVFGPQPWIPAITGALINTTLVLLILWQLYRQHRSKAAAWAALLFSISLFAVNDFKTFTGYYSSSLLFIFSLLLVFNQQYSLNFRFLGWGILAGIGLYIKPLIFLSYLIATPYVVLWHYKHHRTSLVRSVCKILIALGITLAPWHLYKSITLHSYGTAYQQAYEKYNRHFFEHHGTGIAQYREADNKIVYLQKNTQKNTRILNRFLNNHLGISVTLLIAIPFLYAGFHVLYRPRKSVIKKSPVLAALTLVIFGNLFWYLIFSFALTPGHAFFLVFFIIFLSFYFFSVHCQSSILAFIFCLLLAGYLKPAHLPLKQAYSFRANDSVLSNESLLAAAQFIDQQNFDLPLASCGYAGAPWRTLYLRDGSDLILDCYHLLEDGLYRDPQGALHWKNVPDFILIAEGLGLAGESRRYVHEPLLDLCAKNILFRNSYIALCKINGAEFIRDLDPEKTQQQLQQYQHWYRTRLKGYSDSL